MNKHVPNLELCKRLKEAGYPQESEFGWLYWNGGKELVKEVPLNNQAEVYAAPLATELLERLPWRIRDEKSQLDSILSIEPKDKHFSVCYMPGHPDNFLFKSVHSSSLPDALAEMWLWLKENNYL